MPVVSKGKNYVFGQKLEDVAEFVGLEGTGHTPLPPEQLTKKWLIALRASQRYVRQLPDPLLLQDVIPNRPRHIRIMSHHIFRICEAFLDSTINGTEYVSRDQLEAAMAATRRPAAQEGANRGMNMTLDKIQNSPSTRSRVGIR